MKKHTLNIILFLCWKKGSGKFIPNSYVLNSYLNSQKSYFHKFKWVKNTPHGSHSGKADKNRADNESEATDIIKNDDDNEDDDDSIESDDNGIRNHNQRAVGKAARPAIRFVSLFFILPPLYFFFFFFFLFCYCRFVVCLCIYSLFLFYYYLISLLFLCRSLTRMFI